MIKAWEQSLGISGPNSDGQLGQIVEVMLGTSARIGEVLAISRRDLDLTTTPATLRICGTVISERGVGTYRQEHPKTDRSNRVIALPSFTAEALRWRLAIMADHSLDALGSAAAPSSCPPTTSPNTSTSATPSPPTAHRAQGLTVDTAHGVVCDTTAREDVYVAMTRGREHKGC